MLKFGVAESFSKKGQFWGVVYKYFTEGKFEVFLLRIFYDLENVASKNVPNNNP